MKKSVLLTGSSGCLLRSQSRYAKTYDVDLSHTMQAGTVQLKAGSYHVKMDGDKAIFTDVDIETSSTASR